MTVAMRDFDVVTRATSRHVPRTATEGGIDVRRTYAHLPCQRFWTWLTGKAMPNGAPKKRSDVLLSVPSALGIVAANWLAIIGLVLLGALSARWWVSVIVMVLVTNRTRALIHYYHYMSHGLFVRSRRWSRVIAEYLVSIPLLHTPMPAYLRIHTVEHHGHNTICTDEDPDQVYVTFVGLRPGMTEREFWNVVLFAPLRPAKIYRNVEYRLWLAFGDSARAAKIRRAVCWGVTLTAVTWLGAAGPFVLYYLVPLLLISQYSSWIQYVTEHLWFADRRPDTALRRHVAELTWGRFLGRPYPRRTGVVGLGRHAAALAAWWTKVVVVDLPSRVFVYMVDLSSHDHHHVNPNIAFWEIAQNRANDEASHEGWPAYRETWSIVESYRIVRDFLVYAKRPFPAVN